jgi:transcriptional regulator with XRE-family HTH domain
VPAGKLRLVDDLAFGRLVRILRARKGWRQEDLSARAGISRSKVGRIERGALTSARVADIRSIAAALDLRVEVLARGRGADVDRVLNARHSGMHEILAELFHELPGWVASPEVSFAIWGERGVIDILAWHPGRRALLVVELKTEIVDPAGLVATVDRYRRLAPVIAAERGWTDPTSVSCWVVVARSRTNQRRLATHRRMLRTAYPDDGRKMRAWLLDPEGAVAALSSLERVGRRVAPELRVRRRRQVERQTEPVVNARRPDPLRKDLLHAKAIQQ